MNRLAKVCVLPVCLGLLAAPLWGQHLCHAENDGPNFNDHVSMGGPNLLLAIKFVAPISFNCQSIEVFTGERSGVNTVAIWSHNAPTNRPVTSLGSGSWSMSSTNSWQGAALSPVVPLTAGTTYWMVWGPQNGAQASIDLQQPNLGQSYRGSFNGGVTWNGPFQSTTNQWKFRLYGDCCSGFFQVYGHSCTGSNGRSPALAGSGCPQWFNTISLDVSGGIPSAAGLLLFGSGTSAVPLYSSCDLEILPVLPVLVPLNLSGGGAASIPIALPYGGANLDVYAKALLLDTALAPGFSGTNELQIHIQ